MILTTTKKKVAVLYIATGRYIGFWERFYNGCREHFLAGHDVHYYLFTDHAEVVVGDDVSIVPKTSLPWVQEVLRKWETWLTIEDELKSYDYVYNFNANLIPVAPVTEEIFPTTEQGIMVCRHPGFYWTPRRTYTYDKNPACEAYIPDSAGIFYVAGGFHGGLVTPWLEMCHGLDASTKRDAQKGIVALWHDESYLNKYIIGRAPLILTPDYLIPEEAISGGRFANLRELIGRAKMVLIDKSKYEGGHSYFTRKSELEQ